MKSFFQRFHDSSQTGTSKSRTKDAAYKHWISSSKPDKDRAQPPTGAESASNPAPKRNAPKAAGLRLADAPIPTAPGRVGTSYSSRFSTFPGSSSHRHIPPEFPVAQAPPQDPSASNPSNLMPFEDAKETSKLPSRRNEATDLLGNEKEVAARVKSERPIRSTQTSVPPTPQHQIWHPQEMPTGPADKAGKLRKERRRKEDEAGNPITSAPRVFGLPDRNEGTPRELDPQRGVDVDKRQRMEVKERQRAPKERRREESSGSVMKEIERWEREEKDMHQIREREARDREWLLRDRREKEKSKGGTKDRRRERDRGEETEIPAAPVKEQNKDRERERMREMERRKEREREKEREKERREKEHYRQKSRLEAEARERTLQQEREIREQQERELREQQERELRERQVREAREQQEQVRLAKEQRERDRRERKLREQQAERDKREREALEHKRREEEIQERKRREEELQERERRDRELLERQKRERELQERERKEKDTRLERKRREEEQERERREKEQEKERREREIEKQLREKERLDKERIEKERQAQEQKERERQQQEKWEREQDERERKELERLEKDQRRDEQRRREQDSRQRESDRRDLDPFLRERQEQRQREREHWEQQRLEDRERRRRGEKGREVADGFLTDPAMNDKASIRSKRKSRRDGVSDSEKEQGRSQEPDKRRLSRVPAPPQLDTRNIESTEGTGAVDYPRGRGSRHRTQSGQIEGATWREGPRHNARNDESVPEQQNQTIQNHRPSPLRAPDLSMMSVSSLQDSSILPPSLSMQQVPAVQPGRGVPNKSVMLVPGAPSHPSYDISIPLLERATSHNPVASTRVSPSESRLLPLFPSSSQTKTAPQDDPSPHSSYPSPLPTPSRKPEGLAAHVPAQIISRPVPPSAELPPRDIHPPESTPVAFRAVVLTDQPQEIHIHPPPAPIQASHSHTPSISQATSVQIPAPSTKFPSDSIGSTFAGAPSAAEGRILTSYTPPQHSTPEARSLPSSGLADTHTGPTQNQRRQVETLSNSLKPITSIQPTIALQTTDQRAQPTVRDASMLPAPTNPARPPIMTRPPLKESSVKDATNGSSIPVRATDIERGAHPPLKPQILPTPPTAATPIDLRRHLRDKRSSTVAAQHEDTGTSNVKPLGFPRSSPSTGFAKVQDEGGSNPNVLGSQQPLKPPLKPNPMMMVRASPQVGKAPLSESFAPMSQQNPGEKSNNQQENRNQPIPPIQSNPPPIQQPGYATFVVKQRDLDLQSSSPTIHVHDPQFSRHQRHFSETEVARRVADSSPRSQAMKNPQPVVSQLTGDGDSKLKMAEGGPQPDQLTVEARTANIAFRTPALSINGMGNRKPTGAESQFQVEMAPQQSGNSELHQGRRQDASGVSRLVSHYERMDEVARTGAGIVRPGTTVPRARPPPQEMTQTRAAVPSLGYSYSASIPHIDRPSTATGIRPSLSSAPQSQAKHIPFSISKQDRMARLELINFPADKIGQVATQLPPATIVRDNSSLVPMLSNHSSATKPLQSIPEGHTAAISSSATGENARIPLEAPRPLHKATYSDGATVTEPQMKVAVLKPYENHREPLIAAPLQSLTMVNKPHRETVPREGLTLSRHDTGGREDSGPQGELQVMTSAGTHSPYELFTKNDKTDNSLKGASVFPPSTQPQQRKDSSPRVRPSGDQPRSSTAREAGSIDNLRPQSHRVNHSHEENRDSLPPADPRKLLQKTEPVRTDYFPPAAPQNHQYVTELTVPFTHLPDDRSRSKYATATHSLNASQRTPPVNLTSVSPQRTGNSVNSKTDDETSRLERNAVKDPRLAELLSPPPSNDLSHQSYLHDARRTLATKLEQQPDASPNSTHGQSGSEASSRHRGSTSRVEHSPRQNRGADAGSSGITHSSPSGQVSDSTTKDQGHVKSSPNTSHHTPSPRSRKEYEPSLSLPVPQLREESSRYVSGPYPSRPQSRAHERRTEHVSDAEDTLPRKRKEPPHAPNGMDRRSEEIERIPHTTSRPTPQTWDQHSGRALSSRDSSHKESYEPPQAINSTQNRPRPPEFQNTQENSISSSRHAYAPSSHHDVSTEPQYLPHSHASSHIYPSSASTIPPSGQRPDQTQYTRSQSHGQQTSAATREETLTQASLNQPPLIQPTSSKRSYTTPLPTESRGTTASTHQNPPPKYEIWVPPTSSQADQGPSQATTAPSHRHPRNTSPKREANRYHRRSGMPRARGSSPRRESHYRSMHPSVPDQPLQNPYHYLKTRKIRTMSSASLEAQDGAASTVIGSPTASILSQVPINIPPEQDPILAAREWTQASSRRPGQRIRRPGLVWELPEDPPPVLQQEHRKPEPRSSRSRRSRSSTSRSREASDTDQPSSS